MTPESRRQTGFRDQTRAGQDADRPRGRREGARGVGGRRRGLRRRPAAARGHPRPRAGLRAGGRGQPPSPHPRRADPRRPAPRHAARTSLAAALRRGRQPRPAHLLLGVGRAAARRRPRHRTPSPADPPQRPHRRAWPTCAATARARSPLHALVAVAGQRWRIEESFQAAKGLTGLDQHQVRRWTSWHRWTTLAMLAHAFLAVATAAERDTRPRHRPG